MLGWTALLSASTSWSSLFWLNARFLKITFMAHSSSVSLSITLHTCAYAPLAIKLKRVWVKERENGGAFFHLSPSVPSQQFTNFEALSEALWEDGLAGGDD